jgi:hypothetical protein
VEWRSTSEFGKRSAEDNDIVSLRKLGGKFLMLVEHVWLGAVILV